MKALRRALCYLICKGGSSSFSLVDFIEEKKVVLK